MSIPDDKVYSRIFSFPKTVEGARLNEAMQLAINFQLPIKTEDAYLDWERTGGTSLTNEILLSTVPRTVVQGYIAALDFAGIKTLALESHLASIARGTTSVPGHTMLFSKKTPDGATIFALKDGILRFSRTLPSRFVPEDKIHDELMRVKDALTADTKEVVEEMDITNAGIRDDYAGYPELTEPKSKWLVALGAAIRGKIPEGEDNLVSLLPVGTEEAYAYQKATTFANLLRNMTIGVSIFFVVAFFAAYLFMLSLSQNENHTVSILSATPVSPDLLAEEARIDRTNALTETSSSILAGTPLWSTVVGEIMSRAVSGIVISNFYASSPTDTMSLSGVAQSRAILNQFKRSLQDSPMFTGVDIPITNIEQKETIPFSVSFHLKDPRAVYYTQASK